MKNMAILVVGYDGYNSLWAPFFELFSKNWPDCPYNVYLVTNELTPSFPNVNVIKTHKDYQWSSKVREALLAIEEEYIYMLLEDFFICYPVNTKKVEDLFAFIIRNDIEYVKTPYQGGNKKKNRSFKGEKEYFQIHQNQKYGISLLPGIWSKSFLLELIGDGDYNPWKFEVDRIEEAKKKPDIPFEKCFVCYNNYLNIYNGVIQGKYVVDTYKRIKRQGIELSTDKIKLMDYKTRCVLFIKRVGIMITPARFENVVKKIARRFGFSFVSDHN